MMKVYSNRGLFCILRCADVSSVYTNKLIELVRIYAGAVLITGCLRSRN